MAELFSSISHTMTGKIDLEYKTIFISPSHVFTPSLATGEFDIGAHMQIYVENDLLQV